MTAKRITSGEVLKQRNGLRWVMLGRVAGRAGAQTGVAGEGPFVAWLAIRSATEANGRRLTNRPFEVLLIRPH
jgi:hypothetical protein